MQFRSECTAVEENEVVMYSRMQTRSCSPPRNLITCNMARSARLQLMISLYCALDTETQHRCHMTCLKLGIRVGLFISGQGSSTQESHDRNNVKL